MNNKVDTPELLEQFIWECIKNKKIVNTHLHTCFSNAILTDSTNIPSDYVAMAKEKGINGLIFTEHGTALQWYKKKKLLESNDMKYVHAVEGYCCDSIEDRKNYHILVYALNKEGAREVNQLISNAYKREGQFYKRPRMMINEIIQCKNIAIATACLAGVFSRETKESPIYQKLLQWGFEHKNKFFMELQPHDNPDQINYNKELIQLASLYDLQLIVSNDTHYTDEKGKQTRFDKQVAKKIQFSDEDSFDLSLKSYDEMLNSFLELGFDENIIKRAIANTNVLFNMVEEFEVDKNFKMPNLYATPNETLIDRITVILRNDKKPYSQEYLDKRVKGVMQEIGVISKLNVSSYLLMIADWINGLRKEGVRVGYGRGSVNGSIVAYLMGITEINPQKWNTLFFRFLNPEKISMPDVDSDLATSERQIAKEWFYSQKGLHCCEIVTFQKDLEKGSIRSMGRSLGIALKEVEKILENISQYRSDEEYEDFFEKVDELDGFVRGIGIHAGGIVVSDLDIEKEFGVITSIDKDTGKVRRVSQLDMKELDELGYVKVDALGLTTIGVINRACDYIGIDRPHPDNIDFEDDKVWNHLLETDGTLIFQFEKDQAYGYLKKALTNITNMTRIDIATAVSGIIRPCGDHIRNDFFAGKQNDTGSEVVNKYFIRNNGYLIYQEDFMNFLTYFAGYSNAESDIVRKKISKKSGMDEVVDELQDRFPKYFMEHFNESEASTRAVLAHVGQVLLDASLYGFNICHARPYTTTGYVCMWLRYYYPKEFITAALNEFNKKKEKVKDIYKYMNKYTNIKIESPVMGQASMDYSYDKEKDIIYEGMFGLKGVSKNVESALQQLPSDCNSFLDLLIYIKTNKIKMNVRDIRTLTKIDFFRKFGTQKFLLDIIDIYFDIVKYNPNLKTQKTKDKKIATMNEMISVLNKDEDLPFATKMFNELSIRGTTSKRMDWIKDDAIFVVDIKQPYPSYYLVKGFNLKTGDINEYRISRNDMIHSVKKDDIISIIRQEKKERKQLVDGHWTGTGNYYDAIISFSKVILD